MLCTFRVSAYLLLGLLTLLDLWSVVVSFVVFCSLSGTGPGGFETEILGMALLLLPDPVGLGDLPFSWMTGCGFDTLTLGILVGGGGTGGGSAGCGSLGGIAATLGFSRPVSWVLGGLAAVLCISVSWLAGWSWRSAAWVPLVLLLVLLLVPAWLEPVDLA